MAYRYGFFDSIENDRTYHGDDFNDIFDGLIPEKGVFESYKGNQNHHFYISGASTVSSTSSTYYSLTMSPGKAWIKNHWFINDSNSTIEVALPSANRNVYACLYLRFNDARSTRSIMPTLAYGSPTTGTTEPQKPTITNIDTALIIGYIKFIKIDSVQWNVTIEEIVGSETTPYIQTVVPTLEIDSEMSDSSTNAVQNRVIKAYVDELTPDDTVSDESTNSVQNRVIKAYADTKIEGVINTTKNNIKIGSSSAANANDSIVIGNNASNVNAGTGSVVIGTNAKASGQNSQNSIAIGKGAEVASQGSVQIGEGRNTTHNSLQIKSTPWANLATNKLIIDRLPLDDMPVIKTISETGTFVGDLDDGVYFVESGVRVTLCETFNTLYIDGGFIIKNDAGPQISGTYSYCGILACGCLNRTARLSGQGESFTNYNGVAFGTRLDDGSNPSAKAYRFLTSYDYYYFDNLPTENVVDDESTDDTIPTSKAVYDAIIREINNALHPVRSEMVISDSNTQLFTRAYNPTTTKLYDGDMACGYCIYAGAIYIINVSVSETKVQTDVSIQDSSTSNGTNFTYDNENYWYTYRTFAYSQLSSIDARYAEIPVSSFTNWETFAKDTLDYYYKKTN